MVTPIPMPMPKMRRQTPSRKPTVIRPRKVTRPPPPPANFTKRTPTPTGSTTVGVTNGPVKSAWGVMRPPASPTTEPTTAYTKTAAYTKRTPTPTGSTTVGPWWNGPVPSPTTKPVPKKR